MYTEALPSVRTYIHNAIAALAENEVEELSKIRSQLSSNTIMAYLLVRVGGAADRSPALWDNASLADLTAFLSSKDISFSSAVIIPARAGAANPAAAAADPMADAEPAVEPGNNNVVKLAFAASDSSCASHLLAKKTLINTRADVSYRFVASRTSGTLSLTARYENPRTPSQPLLPLDLTCVANVLTEPRSPYCTFLRLRDPVRSAATYADFRRRLTAVETDGTTAVLQLISDGLPAACEISRIVNGSTVEAQTVHFTGFKGATACACPVSFYARHFVQLPVAIVVRERQCHRNIIVVLICLFLQPRNGRHMVTTGTWRCVERM
jgi:hypothetical protein